MAGKKEGKANKAIRYRIYPNEKQKVFFAKTFGCCRKIYNLMLSDAIHGFQTTGTYQIHGPAEYKQAYPYLKEVDSLALANKWTDLNSAFSRYEQNKKKGKKMRVSQI